MSTFWTMALSIMDEKGLRQVDLAKAVNKSKTTVFNWLHRDTLPQADDAVKIAELLGVTVRYLVTGTRAEGELSPLEKRLLEVCKGLSDPQMHKVIKEAIDIKVMVAQEKNGASQDMSGSAIG